MGNDQLELDFSGRRQTIDRWAMSAGDRLPPSEGSRTSTRAMVAVLICLNDHIRDGKTWRLKHSTIAAKCGASVSTCRRAAAELERRKLIWVEEHREHGYAACAYGICWGNIQAEIDEAERSTMAACMPATRPDAMHLADGRQREIHRREQSPPVREQSTPRRDHSECSPCALGVVTMTNRNGHHDQSLLENLPNEHLKRPPSPPAVNNRQWEEVEEQLRLAGVGNWRGIAERSAMTADEALQAIAKYRTCVGLWKPGGLLWAITTGVWPPAESIAQKRYAAACELRKRLEGQGATRGVSRACIAAVVARALHEKNLGEFITSEERQAWQAMKQEAKQGRGTNSIGTKCPSV